MKQNITYRDDEILLILKACESSLELYKALRLLGYLNTLGVQLIRPVVYKLVELKEKELKKKSSHGNPNDTDSR